ncbi:hypothetical protein R69619_04561 [Paraburkholderia nemoris]|nr:hypothetical protein [Paraburkholderia aspalathi]CAE6786749.1 hypothetical protein R69619_04561 [Paraburkholderia nemoris]
MGGSRAHRLRNAFSGALRRGLQHGSGYNARTFIALDYILHSLIHGYVLFAIPGEDASGSTAFAPKDVLTSAAAMTELGHLSRFK